MPSMRSLRCNARSSPCAMSRTWPPKTCVAFWASARLIRECYYIARVRKCVVHWSNTSMSKMSNKSNKKQTFYEGEWVDEITCKEFVEWVTDYLEDKLPAEERRRFDAHLAQCSGCPHYLEQMRETMRV